MLPSGYRWEFTQVDEKQAQDLARQTGCSAALARLLLARGIKDAGSAASFLHPDLSLLHDPFLLKEMDKAARRVLQAMQQKERITIYGDYDVDGITSSSILQLYLSSKGTEVNVYLPDRLREGYGLNEDAVRRIAEDGTKLIITVDTGISGIKEARLAADLGVDMVITDHHECPQELPQACAVVDAKRPGETYPYLYLAGCGTALKLVHALELLQRRQMNTASAEDISFPEQLQEYLELAAVGTIADVVPLTGENRVIVSLGLAGMKDPVNPGLRALLEVSGYDFSRKPSSSMIAFGAGPRLNAGGRMGNAGRGVQLFTSRDPHQIAAIAAQLEEENEARRQTETEILRQVTEQIESRPQIRSSRVIVAAGRGWHHGVVGIVSSRVKETYYRPNIILSIDGETATGSARSVEGFHLYKALCSVSDLLIRFGGHAMAAGMTLLTKDIPEFTERINAYAREHMGEDVLMPVLHPEMKLKPSAVTLEFARELELLEPWGTEMEEPVIVVEGDISGGQAIGKDRATFTARISDEKSGLKMIRFRSEGWADCYKRRTRGRAAGKISINSYMGTESVQMILSDIHYDMDPDARRLLQYFSLRQTTDDYQKLCDRQQKLCRKDCVDSYLLLKGSMDPRGREGTVLALELYAQQCGQAAFRKIYALLQSCLVFEEIGLLRFVSSFGFLRYTLTDLRNLELHSSACYRKYFEN